MSSPYQILDNRPLDQWKVTELKEELRKRRLTLGGLKQDLIKRLDEAIRIEREEAEKEASTISESDPLPVDGAKNVEPVAAEVAQTPVSRGSDGSERVNDAKVQIDINDCVAVMGQEDLQGGDKDAAANSIGEEEDSVVLTVKTSVAVTGSVEAYATVTKQDLPAAEVKSLSEKTEPQLENENFKSKLVNEDLNHQLATETARAPLMSDMHDSPAANKQVSEVVPNIGFQVSSDSISTDSLSINEKIVLKDNIITDNAKLELNLVKPETVEPSSSNVIPDTGLSHPMDVEEPQKNKLSVEERNDDETAKEETGKGSDTADMGYSEKLNLDRSSGDDSMEEDVQESKKVDSNYDSGDVEDKSGQNEGPIENEENLVDIVGHGGHVEKKDVVVVEDKIHIPAEKRKLNDQGIPGNNEPVKRQRKWNSGDTSVSEPQGGLISAAALKETSQVPTPKRNFSRVNSKGIDDSPKERIVPPSQKPATNSLRIDNFVRPFTLKAVQELLGRTGSVTSFWMDHIKTHCYVTYSSEDEAIATRDALYNLRWPPYGGQLLAAEFVEPEEVKVRVEAPSQVPALTPISTGTSVSRVPPSQPQPSPRQKVSEQHVTPVHVLPPPPLLSTPVTVKEGFTLPPPPPPPPLSNPLIVERVSVPPPPLPEKGDPPIVTLDDLFRKTKATPRIYYLPLSEEQVAAKLKGRGRNSRQ